MVSVCLFRSVCTGRSLVRAAGVIAMASETRTRFSGYESSMAWSDREYARGSDFNGPFRTVGGRGVFAGRSVVSILIWANIIIYILCVLTGGIAGPMGSPITEWLAFYTPAITRGQVWRMLTCQYLHASGMHILFNMMGLYFLGQQLERDWGSRQFLAVYTISGFVGSVAMLVLDLIGWLPSGLGVGASGCVLGLLGAAAVRYPHAQVLVYFLFPIKIRTAALVFAGLYALNIISRGVNAGGDACHIAGLAFGSWWAYRGEAWFARSAWHWPRFRSRKPYRRPTISTPFREKVEQRRADAETVDRILKKVYETGIHSLTEAEKSALREATERQKAMES